MKVRSNSFAVCGGAYGDEGKGRIVDMVVHEFSQKGGVVVYRDNGGANAGHTVEFSDGQRVALHQLPSGVFIKKAVVVLGKEMVIHPGDLLEELQQVSAICPVKDRAQIMIDEMAILALDTHRAYESVLKEWQTGGKGSTGRGISPAYADVLYRHPLRIRDIVNFDADKIKKHYALYEALIKGLGKNLSEIIVPTLSGEKVTVGTLKEFSLQLKHQAKQLEAYVADVVPWVAKKWGDPKWSFVFEKAQAVGLDPRWGVYPDVTASDTTFAGIFSATEGAVDPADFQTRAGVIKATYMSSVGARKLPTLVTTSLADKIREDAHEYGATTKRPRDIAYLDIPALRFFAQVGKLNSLILTHMDIVYSKTEIQVCTEYKIKTRKVSYRPDQTFLDQVTPVYKKFQPWSVTEISKARSYKALPAEAKTFIEFLEDAIGVPVIMITTGPQREQGIWFKGRGKK